MRKIEVVVTVEAELPDGIHWTERYADNLRRRLRRELHRVSYVVGQDGDGDLPALVAVSDVDDNFKE